MTEKDTASMTTVQMKADYAASEVYSTASEPPPAYKRQSNSVKIAKITAFTIIVSSFILGAFILASSYLQAKASCDQVQALDSVLEKELMLETLQQVNKELPRAEALLGRENGDDDLQSLDREEPMKKVEHKHQKSEPKPSEEEANENYGDSEETEEMQQKYPGKIPLELDLSELAAALLQNNKKSRMNCVVERKHAEEIVDSPSKTVALPFGMNLTTDPKKARITGERISIFCEGGNENKDQDSAKSNNREEDNEDVEDVESIRPMFIPFQRAPISFGAIPQRYPLTHMPQMMDPMMAARQQQEQQHGFMRQMPPPPPPFQQLPMRPPMPPQEMQAPHPEQQQRIVRIQFHQIPIREMIHVANDVPQQISIQQQQPQAPVQQQQPQPQQVQQQQVQQQQQQQSQQQQQRQEFPFFQIQRMPLGLALERAGITAEDLNNIQRLTENRINEEFRLLANESDEDENSSEDDDENEDNSAPAAAAQNNPQQQQQQNKPQQQSEQQQQQQQNAERQARMQDIPMPIQRLILQPLPEQPRDTMTPPMPDQPMQRLPMGHPGWGRSLAQPVSIPVPMMEAQNDMSAQDDQSSSAQTAEESERPHFVHPRSV